jgi:hypothetical protein
MTILQPTSSFLSSTAVWGSYIEVLPTRLEPNHPRAVARTAWLPRASRGDCAWPARLSGAAMRDLHGVARPGPPADNPDAPAEAAERLWRELVRRVEAAKGNQAGSGSVCAAFAPAAWPSDRQWRSVCRNCSQQCIIPCSQRMVAELWGERWRRRPCQPHPN